MEGRFILLRYIEKEKKKKKRTATHERANRVTLYMNDFLKQDCRLKIIGSLNK